MKELNATGVPVQVSLPERTRKSSGEEEESPIASTAETWVGCAFAGLSLLRERVWSKVGAAFYNKARRELDIISSTTVFSSYWDIFASIYKKAGSFHISAGSRGYQQLYGTMCDSLTPRSIISSVPCVCVHVCSGGMILSGDGIHFPIPQKKVNFSKS